MHCYQGVTLKFLALVFVILSVHTFGAEVYEFKPKPEAVAEPVPELAVTAAPVFEKTIVKQAKAAVHSQLQVEHGHILFQNVRSVYGEGGVEFVCGEFSVINAVGEQPDIIRFSFRAGKLILIEADAMDAAALVRNTPNVMLSKNTEGCS